MLNKKVDKSAYSVASRKLIHNNKFYNRRSFKNLESPGRKFALLFKRISDILASLVLLIVLGFPMIIIAFLIRSESTGPVFF